MISEDLAASLAGSWVSGLLYRRCFMCALSKFFQVVKKEFSGPAGSKAVALSRAQAQELVLLSAPPPVLCSNVAVLMDPGVFASDASLSKGAVCFTEASPSVSEALWQSADSTWLDSPERAALKAYGVEFVDSESSGPDLKDGGPQRPIAMVFDFMWPCSGESSL